MHGGKFQLFEKVLRSHAVHCTDVSFGESVSDKRVSNKVNWFSEFWSQLKSVTLLLLQNSNIEGILA